MSLERETPAERPVTAEPPVDDAIRRLDDLSEMPVSEHVGVFDESHRTLQDALADLDEE
jgi:hypothetical protein